ncbi:MAG: capsule assembly Wzi family protein, partial [Opitutales bacterium]
MMYNSFFNLVNVYHFGFGMVQTTGNGGLSPFLLTLRALFAGTFAFFTCVLEGGPFAESGDPFLRHDLQLLRDNGFLEAPITTWPLSMGGLHAALHDLQPGDDLSAGARAALERTKLLLESEKQRGWSAVRWELSARSKRPILRSFLNTPREKQEAAVSSTWLGDRFAGGLTVRGGFNRSRDWVGREDDAVRFDGSYLSTRLGNYSFSLDQLDRWWGPGWDGSLILSNNARPVPAITAQRRIPNAFESPWLNWLGPWNSTTFMGRMEDDRTGFPHPWLFGSRLDFAPTIVPGLEVGLSRTIQWGGKGRPNGLGTFVDAWLSQDNGSNIAQQPGNQLAGIDLRYKMP